MEAGRQLSGGGECEVSTAQKDLHHCSAGLPLRVLASAPRPGVEEPSGKILPYQLTLGSDAELS